MYVGSIIIILNAKYLHVPAVGNDGTVIHELQIQCGRCPTKFLVPPDCRPAKRVEYFRDCMYYMYLSKLIMVISFLQAFSLLYKVL